MIIVAASPSADGTAAAKEKTKNRRTAAKEKQIDA
jgi:hypothetical protein